MLLEYYGNAHLNAILKNDMPEVKELLENMNLNGYNKLLEMVNKNIETRTDKLQII